MAGSNGVPTCTARVEGDLCGAPAVLFPSDGEDRCLVHAVANGETVAALRSDVPPCPRCAAAEASADAAHAALEATMLRLGEVEAVLEEFPGTGGPAALRKLRGEVLP